MCKETEALIRHGVSAFFEHQVSPTPILSNCPCDGTVQTSVQRAKFFGRKGRTVLDRKVADGLTEIPVVLNDLLHGEPLLKEFCAMHGGRHGHLSSLLPVCVWRLFVASRLFADFGWAAMVPNPGDFGAPFAGLLHLWQAGIAGTQPAPEIAGAMVFPLILTAALILAVALLYTRPGPIETAAAVYAGMAVSLNYGKIWSHLPSGERGTFELFICLLLLLLESGGRPAWVRQTLTGLFVGAARPTRSSSRPMPRPRAPHCC